MTWRTVQEDKDLGVFVITDLKVAKQCNQAYCRANRMLELLREE